MKHRGHQITAWAVVAVYAACAGYLVAATPVGLTPTDPRNLRAIACLGVAVAATAACAFYLMYSASETPLTGTQVRWYYLRRLTTWSLLCFFPPVIVFAWASADFDKEGFGVFRWGQFFVMLSVGLVFVVGLGIILGWVWHAEWMADQHNRRGGNSHSKGYGLPPDNAITRPTTDAIMPDRGRIISAEGQGRPDVEEDL